MKPKHLIIDLFGVLFLINKRSILYQLGMWNVLKFYTKYRTNPFDHCLLLLDAMRLNQKDEFQNIVAYKDCFLPESLCLWQKGLLDNEKALSNVCTYIDALPLQACHDRNIIKKTAQIIFSAQALIPALTLNSSFYKQLVTYKKNYSLILFSNIDLQTWNYIKKIYSPVIELFDGAITSGESHLLKPDPQIFNHLLHKYNLNAHECLLIDDQLENCKAAKNLGLSYIHYNVGQKLNV